MSQTTYLSQAPIAYEGMPGTTREHVIRGYKASGAMKAGTLCQLASEDQVKYPAAVADDPDSIVETEGASAATEQNLVAADFDGTIGSGRIVPAQRISITCNSHADWDATVNPVRGEDDQGRQIDDALEIADGGNGTFLTKKAFSRAEEIDILAQSGTNGTFTIGTVNDDQMICGRFDFPGIPVKDVAKQPTTETVITGVTADWPDKSMVPVMTKGDIWVKVEAAVAAGDPVYARMTESGTDIRGQFRGSPATGFAKVPGAKFLTTQSSADGLALLEL